MFSIPELLTLAEQTEELPKKRGILIALHAREYEFRTEEEGRRFREIRIDVQQKLVKAGFGRVYQG